MKCGEVRLYRADNSHFKGESEGIDYRLSPALDDTSNLYLRWTQTIEAAECLEYPGWVRHGDWFLPIRLWANEVLKEVPKTGSGMHVRPPLETSASSQTVYAKPPQRMDVDNGPNLHERSTCVYLLFLIRSTNVRTQSVNT